MNPNLDKLKRYPFERLADLKQGVAPNADQPHIALSIGEPKHAPPEFVVNRLTDAHLVRKDLATYPATRGSEALRTAIAAWVQQRFETTVDPATQVLPVAGTREALFSFAQAVMSGANSALALLPNPFYQIYEGAVLLAGGEPRYIGSYAENTYEPDFDAITPETWQRTELVYLCSPSNPTGRVMSMPMLQSLIEKAHVHDFVVNEAFDTVYAAAHGKIVVWELQA